MPFSSFSKDGYIWDEPNWYKGSWDDLIYEVSLIGTTLDSPIRWAIGVQYIPVDKWMDEPLLGGKNHHMERKIEMELELEEEE